MKKNMIWLIPLAIFLVFSVAAGAVFAVMYTKSMTDLRASARRSADAMFGDWTEIVRKIKTLESDREREFSVEAGLDIPGEMAGLGESLKVTATDVRDTGGSESVTVSLAGKGDPARAGVLPRRCPTETGSRSVLTSRAAPTLSGNRASTRRSIPSRLLTKRPSAPSSTSSSGSRRRLPGRRSRSRRRTGRRRRRSGRSSAALLRTSRSFPRPKKKTPASYSRLPPA